MFSVSRQYRSGTDFSIDPEVRKFVTSLDKNRVGKIVNFGSAAILVD